MLMQKKEKNDSIQVAMTGVLSTGKKWQIVQSRKRSPGLIKGEHLSFSLIGDESPIHEVSQTEWIEIVAAAHNFAMFRTAPEYNFRIAYNGPGVGTRNHIHIHIMIPENGDNLPFLVQRGDKAV